MRTKPLIHHSRLTPGQWIVILPWPHKKVLRAKSWQEACSALAAWWRRRVSRVYRKLGVHKRQRVKL